MSQLVTPYLVTPYAMTGYAIIGYANIASYLTVFLSFSNGQFRLSRVSLIIITTDAVSVTLVAYYMG